MQAAGTHPKRTQRGQHMPSTGKHRLQAFGVQAQQGDRRRRRDVQVTLRLSASCAVLKDGFYLRWPRPESGHNVGLGTTAASAADGIAALSSRSGRALPPRMSWNVTGTSLGRREWARECSAALHAHCVSARKRRQSGTFLSEQAESEPPYFRNSI